jgi:hypothetical protein
VTQGRRLPENPASTARSGPVAAREAPFVEIVGRLLPWDAVPVQTKQEKVAIARAVIRGLKKSWGPREVLRIWGEDCTVQALIDRYQQQLDAIAEVDRRYAAWRGAVRREKQLRRPMQVFSGRLRRRVQLQLGPDALADFEWAVPKKPGPKTLAGKLAGAQKRAKKKASK